MDGSQSSTTRGAEPSGGGCIAPPGQRWNWRNSNPSRRLAGAIGVRKLVPAMSVWLNGLKIGWMRA